MPEEVKINLVNEMAHPPASWTAMTTMAKTESKISTARHDFAKNPTKHKVRAHTQKRNTFLTCHKINTMHTHITPRFRRSSPPRPAALSKPTPRC
jgi:hypothetical protein